MPGVPFMYYGNEIGMRQLPTSWPQVEGAYRPRNGARTPMQWNKSKNLGFSNSLPEKLYLPVDTAIDAPNVAIEENDSMSLLNRTRKLIKLRHTEPALASYAEFTPLYAKTNKYPFIYSRALGTEVVIVLLNPSGKDEEAEFQLNISYNKTHLLAGNDVEFERTSKGIKVKMTKQSYSILKLE